MSNAKRIKLLLICALVAIVAIVAIEVKSYYSRQHGNVTINLNLASAADARGVSIHFNDQAKTISKLQQTYVLNDGSYTITATKAGYKEFSTKITLRTGQDYIINVNLALVKAPSLVSPQQITTNTAPASPTQSNIPALPADTQITQTTFYDNKTWAVITLSAYGGDTAIAVLEYNAGAQDWDIALGPGTDFTAADIQTLPTDVQQYFNSASASSSGSQ